MPSSEYHFDDSGLALVDKWMMSTSAEATPPAQASTSEKKRNKQRTVSTASVLESDHGNNTNNGKKGLGYGADAKSKKKSRKSVGDAAYERITQHKNDVGKKRKAVQAENRDIDDVVDDDDDDDGNNTEEMHGMVEDFTESRTSAKVKVKVLASKARAAPGTIKNKSNKESSNDDALYNDNDTDKHANKKQKQHKGDEEDANKRAEEISRGIRPGKGGYWSQVYDDSNPNPNPGNDGKRKRPKTRSKQKNIRKDNRPESSRPNFRPLTNETKDRMNSSRDAAASQKK